VRNVTFKCNPLWSLQPVQLTQERSDDCWNFDEEKISRAAAFITDMQP